MKRLCILSLALLLAAPSLLLAQKGESIGLSEVVATLEGPFRSGGDPQAAIHDFQGDFFQESRIVSLDRLQRGRGRVSVKFDRDRGDLVPRALFRWEYDQPTTQEIVSDGSTIWVYLPENRQVIRSEIDFTSQARANDPVTFLTGLGNLSRDFLITWASPNQDLVGNWVLELRPRRVSPMIERMQVVVAREAVLAKSRSGQTGSVFPILSTLVYDPSGNSTLIEFSNVRVNRGLSAGQFNFILPAGVEVLRPTGAEMGF
ncbi:outer-membrane lipoprotein carrier protein [Desulfuromonas versatilis]|uniref:Outer-membrane lipoprotein carrier protein n=1 Tax=Desulfuromonas versatilis TaxID=2802975 RepID=A0ABM8I0K9_9BACT|nr:outer membrane lipoprotein carrier protein LolA [Desulfuromonas versatilis]BCR06859.1 outer-membrane lipoprotein carrier protein [Desulfuromonas versatilis]